MSTDKINYIDAKEEKDFQAWKKDKTFYPWQDPLSAYRSEEEKKKQKERLQKEGVKQQTRCPGCGVEEYIYPEIMVLPEYKYTERYCFDCENKQKEEEKRKEEEKYQAEQEAKKEKRKFDFILKIPHRYEAVRFSEETNKDQIHKYCSIFYGGFGTGKTWSAYRVAYDMFTGLYIDDFEHITEVGLLNEIKAGFSDNTFDKRVEKYKNVDLLIVDEMGKNNDSDFNKAQIFEILNYRYDWEYKTILICNCEEKKELLDILSPAILDRFRESIVHYDGKSKRYKTHG